MAPFVEVGKLMGSNRLTDDQVDIVLREAEKRLSSQDPTLNLAVAQPTRSRDEDAGQQKLTEPKENFTVRLPQLKQAKLKDTAGNNWFNLPKTDLTPEMKRDWQILRMRNVLDPKQQRKTLRAEPPKYSQVGEIVAGPTDFYSSRMTRKERKQNLLQEAFDERDETKFRNKYAGIQKDKTSGKKAFYKKLVSQRRRNKG